MIELYPIQIDISDFRNKVEKLITHVSKESEFNSLLPLLKSLPDFTLAAIFYHNQLEGLQESGVGEGPNLELTGLIRTIRNSGLVKATVLYGSDNNQTHYSQTA